VPDYQRIHVVSTTAADAEPARLPDLRRDPVVITAPTADAARVVRALGVEPQVEVLLAPVRFPDVDRGHRLDELVRAHALRDRFRDLVVVTDPASAVLLLRVLAPSQLADGGPVTVVGLARGERPVAVPRALVTGVVLGAVVAFAERLQVLLALPVVLALVGLVVFLVVPWRHVGRELLLASAVSVAVGLAIIAGSARFPAGF
jgi:hypothetical protein